MIPALPGTYVLILRCRCSDSVAIGSLGEMQLRPGCYLYIGSAFGPGGLRARIGHHQRTAERPRWHIDYLRARLPISSVWYCALRCEHQWAASIRALPGAEIPLPGLGSSDCGCETHLLYFSALRWAALRRALRPGAV